MGFKVGDRVVYPHHGAAIITKKEKRKSPTGEQKDYLVLRMAHGEMTLHVPVVSLPAGRGPAGLPLSVQLIGRAGDDAEHLARVATIERALAA